MDALIDEIHFLGKGNPGLDVHTIFFGGGTPSLLTIDQYQHLFRALHQHFTILPDAETTLECNPNDLNLPYVSGLREAGFNRISIGMQSATARDLKLFDRRHDMQMVVDAVAASKQAGFTNINLDLIYGIPDQTLDEWAHTLDVAIGLEPTHFSMYALELKGGTPLREQVEAYAIPPPDDDLTADMYEMASDKMEQAGFEQYEISNWSKPGLRSRHNLQYWYQLPYAGLGPGAHGFAGGVRYSNMLLPQRYIDAIKTHEGSLEFPRTPATARAVRVDHETEVSETVMMSLRLTKEGLHRETFQKRFGFDFVEQKQAVIDKFVGYGMLYYDTTHVRLTRAGRFLSNAIIRELI